MGFSLRVNSKKIESGMANPSDPKKRDQQFGHIGNLRELFARHGFPTYAVGKAVPYGIYDTQKNSGTVFIGHNSDTPSFAVECQDSFPLGRNNDTLILGDWEGVRKKIVPLSKMTFKAP